MKKLLFLPVFIALIACGSTKSFQSFFNEHKNDIGVTAFQVPNFMKTLLGSISPEMNGLFGKVNDFKFITFNEITPAKQQELIQQLNLVTSNYKDILRKNSVEKTKIVAVIEHGDIVKQAIIFNATPQKAAAFYLKGNFNPNELQRISETNQFEELSDKLIQNNFQTPINKGFNPYQQ